MKVNTPWGLFDSPGVDVSLGFGSQVSAWVNEQKERLLAVAQESTSRLVSVIQNTPFPVKTGFARASIVASLEEMPSIRSGAIPKKGATYSYDPGAVEAVIASAQLGDTIHVGWTAAYVESLEYGHSKQAPSGMVRIGCAQWPQIVAQVSAEAQTRSGS